MTAAPPITCRYAHVSGYGAACGAFSSEHHARASEAGVCCADLAFRDVGDDLDHQDVTASTADDWPLFDPSDEDAPFGGDW